MPVADPPVKIFLQGSLHSNSHECIPGGMSEASENTYCQVLNF